MKIATMGGALYDANVVPVAVILTQTDRENIARMPAEATIYCGFPNGIEVGQVNRWLDTLKEPGAVDAFHCETNLDENGEVSGEMHVVSEAEHGRRTRLWLQHPGTGGGRGPDSNP